MWNKCMIKEPRGLIDWIFFTENINNHILWDSKDQRSSNEKINDFLMSEKSPTLKCWWHFASKILILKSRIKLSKFLVTTKIFIPWLCDEFHRETRKSLIKFNFHIHVQIKPCLKETSTLKIFHIMVLWSRILFWREGMDIHCSLVDSLVNARPS